MPVYDRQKFKKFLTNASIVAGTLVVIITGLELSALATSVHQEAIVCNNCMYYVSDERFGYVAKPRSVVDTSQYCGSNLCFKARYTFDEFSRRITGIEKRSARHLLTFGCSFTFGAGLNDEDTLPYLIQQKTSSRVYNYAKGAAGPAHALAILDSPEIQNQVPENEGIALYFLMPFHTERVSLSTRTPWLWKTPAYDFSTDGDVHFVGKQSESSPALFWFYSAYNKIRNHSYFLKKLGREFDSKSQGENEDLLVAILKKSKATYEAKFKGEFIIVNPVPLPESLLRKMAAARLEYIQIDNNGSPENDNVCSCDPHPNGARNRFITEALDKIIRGH